MSTTTTTQAEVVDIDCTIIPYGQRNHEHRQEEEEQEEDEDEHRQLVSCEPDRGGGAQGFFEHLDQPIANQTIIVESSQEDELLQTTQVVNHTSSQIIVESDIIAPTKPLVEQIHFQKDANCNQIETTPAHLEARLVVADVDDEPNEEEGDEEDDDGDEDDDEDDESEEDDDEEEDDDDDDDSSEEEDDDEDVDDDLHHNGGRARLDEMDDIVDPGQNCLLISHASDSDGFMIDSIHQQQQQHQLHNEQQIPPQTANITNNSLPPKSLEDNQDILDGERMLEVTRKLVRNTERDPDRDLRKQVLLKTAIKKLPHFMDYHNRYSDNLDQSFQNSNLSPQAYYEHHHLPSHPHHPPHHIHNSPHLIHHDHDEIQQKSFYHPVQPNAMQMSTTSLRMLDLNDDRDVELSSIDQQDHHDPDMSYTNHSCTNNTDSASLEQHDYISQQQYERYHNNIHDQNSHPQQENHNPDQRNIEFSHHHYDNSSPILSRHNSLDNLYQPISGGEINDDMKDERIPIAFQIACEIYDFTCAPDDNEKKLLDNLTNGYYATRPTKNTITRDNHHVDDIDDDDEDEDDDDEVRENGTDTRDQDGSDTSSSSHSSSSYESANSLASQSTESDGISDSTLLEASLNSSSNFYHSSHDSGVALFSPRSNKRSSSSIGLDEEMDIDQLTELSTRTSSIGSNNQYKKLRKRELID